MTKTGFKKAAGESVTRLLILTLVMLLVSALAACSGGSGQDLAVNPPPPQDVASRSLVYTGPAPQTDDIQQFRVHVWDNLAGDDRCGQCHDTGGSGTSSFVRRDDINKAYAEASALVNLDQPALSLMAEKVAGGHNCWLASNTACGDILASYIRDWAGLQGGEALTVSLSRPEFYQAGTSRLLPDDPALFVTHLWQPLLRRDATQFCSRCHAEDAATPQQPFFASADADVAWDAARSKIDLNDPARSRLVQRLRTEFHNCWSDCAANAQQIENAISLMADAIPAVSVPAEMLVSGALVMTRDGIIASGGGRFENDMIARYQFKAGAGSTAFDTSTVTPALNLQLTGTEGTDYVWENAWGIRFLGGRAQGLSSTSAKLYDLITATSEYSVEVWVAPANVSQDDSARIVSYSGSDSERNFTLGQSLYNYDFLNRSSENDANGMPALSTADADEILQATLQHVVVTYDPIQGRAIYVNGIDTGVADNTEGGSLADWDRTFALTLGDEVSGNHPFMGTIRFLAIYNRSLKPAQIQTNFAAGTGQRYFLLFSLTGAGLTTLPEVYVKFTVEQFDNFSYLFREPELISLDDSVSLQGLRLKGMRVGINGREAATGQAWARLDLQVPELSAGESMPLSGVGTLIEVENGPDADEFFLTFDEFGSADYDRPVQTFPPLPAEPDKPVQPRLGVRHFASINATLAQLTNIPAVRLQPTYATLSQALPVQAQLSSFLTAHQMAISQLTVAYCGELAADPVIRNEMFPGFDFSLPPSAAFAPGPRRILTDALTARLALSVTSGDLTTQPSAPAVANELNILIDQLIAGGSADTGAIVMASCAAAFANATMLVE
ncbi:MAG: LamG domain-containing protein [Pseudomonadales bacterium]|nr:LamG domain-containing protein [Pseudomonadales bacterium]